MEKFKGIINDKLEIVVKEFQGIIGFAYIILILLGMLFETIYYSQFGINIFNYSGILDFLLVPFRRPVVLFILLGVSLFIYMYFYVLYSFLHQKFPNFHRKFYGKYAQKEGFIKSRIVVLLIFFLIITIAWAYVTSKNGKEELVKKNVDVRIEFDTTGTQFVEGKMIGKNELNIFLLDKSNKIKIIPANSDIVCIKPLN